MNGAVLAFDGRCRMLLERGEGPRTAAWLMCNPSTADATLDDPTVRRVRHFSAAAGCGRFVVVNLWPWRATQPADLWRALQRGDHTAPMHEANLDAIAQAGAQADVSFVAFGAEPWRRYRGHALACATLLGGRPLCLGVTPDGAPLHPLARGKLAVRNGTEPFAWRG